MQKEKGGLGYNPIPSEKKTSHHLSLKDLVEDELTN